MPGAGPNMAGKSTILRSVAAVALCGLCGLLVPARRARIPQFDRVELHTFVGDSPSEGMSAFAVEMHEMACVPCLHLSTRSLQCTGSRPHSRA